MEENDIVILSVFTKTFCDKFTKRFSVSYFHHACETCANGKIRITSPVKDDIAKKYKTYYHDPPSAEDFSKSCFYQRHLKSFAEIKHNSIPGSYFSSLGVKLTKSLAEKLNRGCDLNTNVKSPSQNQDHRQNVIKSPSKTNNYKKKKLRKSSRTENKEPNSRNLSSKNSPSKTSSNKESEDIINHVTPIKKQVAPPELIKIVKTPTKGTLRRRRLALHKLNETNSTYEDDLFADQKFFDKKISIEEDADPEKYDNMRTPRIMYSPVRDSSCSPTCNDYYSPSELISIRKAGEEYLFRRRKRRKLKLDEDEKTGSKPSPEKPTNTEDQTRELIMEVKKHLKNIVKTKECEKESDEDEYFTDSSDDSD